MNTQRTTLEAVNRSNALYHDSPLRRAGMIVGAGALMLVLSALIVVPTVRADEITVEDGLVAENATDGQCSLIEAIQAANTNSPVGGCNGGSADDTIILAVGGTDILTETYASDTGLPIITSTITFEGNRATIRRDRDSSDNFRILQVGDGLGGAYPGNLTLNNVTIAGGRLDSADSLHGGGIFSSAGGSSLSIHNSTIKDNVAGGSGGGIYAPDSLTMTNSTVYSNTGGGPFAWGGGLAIGTATITNSTISGNTAYGSGGVHANGRTWIAHSTIVKNAAGGYGGGLGSSVQNQNYITLSHTIISGNQAAHGDNEISASTGTVGADDYNLFGHAGETENEAFSNFTPGAKDINATRDDVSTPLTRILDVGLRDNGGDTWTHALVAGSPAIDGGDPAFGPPPQCDQRGSGFDRVVKNHIDIGAYEYRRSPVGGVTRSTSPSALLRPWITFAGFVIATAGGAALLPRLHRRCQRRQ